MLSEDQAFWFVAALLVAIAIMCIIQSWMKLIQTAIFISVMFAGIYWEWPGSSYSHVFAAVVVTIMLTVVPIWIYDLGRSLYWLLARIYRNPQRFSIRRRRE